MSHPSHDALATVMRQAQVFAPFPVSPHTRVADLHPMLATPKGYGFLLSGHGLDGLPFPERDPQTLHEVAYLLDYMRTLRDRRLAEGTAPYAAVPPVVAGGPSRSNRVKPWHLMAAMLGFFGLVLSLLASNLGTGWTAFAIPIGSAVLFGWLLWQILPPWVPALLVGGMGLMAAVKVTGVKARDQQVREAARLDLAMRDVCDGKPLARKSNGYKLRAYDRHADFWSSEGGWPDGNIPAFVLCTEHRGEDVACGDFVDSGAKEQRATRICTSRDIATAVLRRAETAEVVFRKEYRGSEPPQLGYSVQLGGGGSTKLGGDRVSYETVYADIKAILDAAH